MKTSKHTFFRNACFSFGVLVGLLCVFPPPESVTRTLNLSNNFKDNKSIVEIPLQEVMFEAKEVQGSTRRVSSRYIELYEMATKFCLDHAADIGVDPDNLSGCVEPVMNYLHEQTKSAQVSGSTIIAVDVNVQGSVVHFEVVEASPDDAREQATVFCTTYGAEFDVTEESLPLCIDTVQRVLQVSIASFLGGGGVQGGRTAMEPEQEPKHEKSTHEGKGEGERDEEEKEGKGAGAGVESRHRGAVFVTSFPLGTKTFEYRHVLGTPAAANARTFCNMFWSELEGAFVEAGMTGIDEAKCSLVVEEVTLDRVQHFAESLDAGHSS